MMISDNENHRRTDCPFCGAADSMEVFVHIRGNKHMQAKCAACGDGIIE
jgi:transcription elongation factor Elf1